MRAAPPRRRGRCANVAKNPTGALTGVLSARGGGAALDDPGPLSARGGGGDLGMRRPFGPEEACPARGGREGQAALTALAGSMLDVGMGEAARRASRFEGGLGPMSSDPGDPDDESAALRARLDRLKGDLKGRGAPPSPSEPTPTPKTDARATGSAMSLGLRAG